MFISLLSTVLTHLMFACACALLYLHVDRIFLMLYACPLWPSPLRWCHAFCSSCPCDSCPLLPPAPFMCPPTCMPLHHIHWRAVMNDEAHLNCRKLLSLSVYIRGNLRYLLAFVIFFFYWCFCYHLFEDDQKEQITRPVFPSFEECTTNDVAGVRGIRITNWLHLLMSESTRQ